MNIVNVWQRDFLLSIVRLVAGAYPVWHQGRPAPTQKIYFSNHTSHIDTLAILAALPRDVRAVVRPVAARDYWDSGNLKRHIAQKLLNVVLIDRHRESGGDPLDPVRDALRQGHSIIIFPEGTRGADVLPQPFKSGLYHLATEFPDVALAPVYLENLQRIMPKGTIWPVPLICNVHFGANDALRTGEDKPTFLARMRDALVALAPPQRPAG
ncbi:lysophospholipid acyltransferase family protein [Burkholderia vietnamiensis]|jgi:1-acyl-sn-glycerol-3-phosphate acyltransferase|uniref:lysophospholipid acyltransferase family protein n=1 Tax=Burkholderia vietnamiensis TaxID=60552 RepID=UPI001041872F|nr:lysophospholipid acyltransferase family protein [Burkholderia vietnamiensis]MBR8000691.1 1-acyl-sn-glycerol-3-phosphate acyltransferase [Burkholderia vietnamiensis]MBR8055582.1 1-acyl-sn-glycerol-3-phosphate acyltransferase [Burkholderia vietnamiensis]MCA8194150.1 1-acyl-sn-glycerol-3-phosphate acyltransferase [Burkholderia vietnamiensis]